MLDILRHKELDAKLEIVRLCQALPSSRMQRTEFMACLHSASCNQIQNRAGFDMGVCIEIFRYPWDSERGGAAMRERRRPKLCTEMRLLCENPVIALLLLQLLHTASVGKICRMHYTANRRGTPEKEAEKHSPFAMSCFHWSQSTFQSCSDDTTNEFGT